MNTNKHLLFKYIPENTPYVYIITDINKNKLYLGSTEGKNPFYLGSGNSILSIQRRRRETLYIRPIFWHSNLKLVRRIEGVLLNYLDVVKNPLFYNLTLRSEGGDNIKDKNESERQDIIKRQKQTYQNTLKLMTSEQRKERFSGNARLLLLDGRINYIVTKFSKGNSLIYEAVHKKTKEVLLFTPTTLELYFKIWYGSIKNIIEVHNGEPTKRTSNSQGKKTEQLLVNDFNFSYLTIDSFNEELLRENLLEVSKNNKNILGDVLGLSYILLKNKK